MANQTQNSSQPYPDMARIEHLLTQGQISSSQGVMRWGSNYAALITVGDEDLQAAAVYKPQRGERPLWDFPDGTLCYREVAAYLISQALGWQIVPPTVLRSGPHGIGSVQLFIEHNPEVNYFALDESFAEQLRRYAAFDYVINNADRKGGHLLLDKRGKLWGIDHGLTFHTMPKLRTVIWDFAGQHISDSMLASLQALCEQIDQSDSSLRCALAPLLSVGEINTLSRRIRQLLDCEIYPKPGPGPNYPWPPV